MGINLRCTPLYRLGGAFLFLMLLAGCWMGALGAPSPTVLQAGLEQGRVGAGQNISPLLLGTNLVLSNNQDPFVTSAQTRAELSQIGIRLVRMPWRPFAEVSEATDLRTLTDIRNMAATPLLILRGPGDAQALTDDQQEIKDATSVFGPMPVYYEFGNELDLAGVSDQLYTMAWNAIIPQLKAMAPAGRFVGPVNFHFNQGYLHTFLLAAKPQPDAVSWHEYSCADTDPAKTCLDNIANWSTHIQDARNTMAATVGSALPVMITEWNYSPKFDNADGNHADSAFRTTWTQQALRALANNDVFASAQYAATTLAPLIKNNVVVPEGTALQQFAQQTQQPGRTRVPVAAPRVLPPTTPIPAGTGQPSQASTAPPPAHAGTTGSVSPPAATPVAMPTNTDTGARAPISPHMGTFGPDGQTWGPAWGGDSRNGQIFEVRKGAGQISGGQGVFTALTGQTSSTVSVTATGTMSQFQQGATNFGIIARALDTHNLYKLYIDGSFLVLQKRVAGQATILAQTPFAAQDGVSYTLSLQAQGNTLSGRVWASASPSPVNPMVTASDASLASGQAGVRVQLQPTTVVTFTAFQVR